MGYKFKPNKAVAKRFKVTAKGKLKRHHSLTSHLRSARTAKKKRELRRPELLFEGHARRLRKVMGIGGMHPYAARKSTAPAAKTAPAAPAAPTAPIAKSTKSASAKSAKKPA